MEIKIRCKVLQAYIVMQETIAEWLATFEDEGKIKFNYKLTTTLF